MQGRGAYNRFNQLVFGVLNHQMTMGSMEIISSWPILLAFLLLSISSLQFSHATDTLPYGESITDGQTLVSAGGNFELGFFSPGNSKNRYAGIWYHRVPQQTVVWVANRENPIRVNSGILTINNDGNLMIMDSRGGSYVLATGSASKNTSAKLLDTGNFVLRLNGDEGAILWQSFDHPTDTLLPHMKLELTKTPGKNMWLSSWRSSVDPAPGNYTVGFDPNGTSQFIVWQRGSVYWISGTWNGEIFSLDPDIPLKYVFNFSYTTDEHGNYFSYWPHNNSTVTRLVMEVSGVLQQSIWLERSSKKWDVVWTIPKGQCDVYKLCGAFGNCHENAVPICECLQGFEPASQIDWSKGVWSSGCMRKTNLHCGKSLVDEGKDVFLKLPMIHFRDNPQNFSVKTHEQCKLACMNNCTCNAYVYDGGCSIWTGNLFNLVQRSEDDEVRGGDLYLRLAASELMSTKDARKMKRLPIIIGVTVAVLLVLFGIFMRYLLRRKIKQKDMTQSNQTVSLLELSFLDKQKFVNKLVKIWSKIPELQLFSFEHIAAATNNFSSTNKLGQGGFGPVYKGKFLEGQEVAVKRLSRNSGQGLDEFINEVALIAKLQHKNLVRLLGCCIEGEEKMLVYEYMPNRSLDLFLFDPTKQKQLDWEKRVRIIDGVTQGLLYLHTYSRLRIIHRDLKTSNILLDAEMNPKISDFGMARIVGWNESETQTNRVVGTYGYMSPEYAMKGLFSEKSDVYSFGVLLLEILCGKKNTGFDLFDCYLNLTGYAWELWKEGKGFDFMDPTLVGSSPTPELTRYIHVALLCVQESASDRPTMSDVVFMLKNEVAPLPIAKQPAFLIKRTSFERRSEMDKQRNSSINDVSVSEVDAR